MMDEPEKGITEGLIDEKFNIFLETVDARFRSFISQINEYLAGNGCKCDIKSQKSGYVVSYVLNSTKRTLVSSIRNAAIWRSNLH